MRSQVMWLLPLFSLFSAVYCGEITVGYAPPTLRFGTAGVLRGTDFDDMMAAALGYTPAQSSPWKGLTITSPFSAPMAAVVVEVHGAGATVRQEGATYGLKEDTTIDEVFRRLKSVYGGRAQRHTLFKHIPVEDNSDEENSHYTIPEATELDVTQEPDGTFLREMAALIVSANTAKDITTTLHGGQDVIFLDVKSLALLVNTYGVESPQVSEAIDILRAQLAKSIELLRHIYNDRVLVVTATVDQGEKLLRKKRSLLENVVSPADSNAINLAKEYTEDFPVVFNIILWISIVLGLTVLAMSVATATMDPGRDSIIYRMTNPRMKKDN